MVRPIKNNNIRFLKFLAYLLPVRAKYDPEARLLDSGKRHRIQRFFKQKEPVLFCVGSKANVCRSDTAADMRRYM